MMRATPFCEYKPGLEGIPATQSSISYLDGMKGILEYRGIAIEELAKKASFLETTYLLIWGQLPSAKQLEEFAQEILDHRRLKYRLLDMMKCFPETGQPLDALQTSAAALGLFSARRALNNPEYIRKAVIRLIAKMPTLVAAFARMHRGNDPIQPNDSLDYAANFLYMLTEKRPHPLEAQIFDVCLTLYAEHTINASTLSAMVTASTLTTPYAVVASAVGTLAGPLHGGANQEVLSMLEEIGLLDNVLPYVEDCIAQKKEIKGFGQGVARVKDPRANILKELAQELFNETGPQHYYDLALELERVVEAKLGKKGIYPHVDFYSGLVYRQLGIPRELFTPILAIARVAGWLAHWKEQLTLNRLFRPTQVYTGEHNAPYIPLAER